jgi:hypothetical protein
MPHFFAHSKFFSYIYENTPLLQSYSSIAGHEETYLNPGFSTEMLLVLSYVLQQNNGIRQNAFLLDAVLCGAKQRFVLPTDSMAKSSHLTATECRNNRKCSGKGMTGGWSTPRPGRLTPKKETPYPFYRRLGGPHCRSGWVWKISPPPAFDLRTVHPVASRYTDYALPAHKISGPYRHSNPGPSST